MDILLVFKSNSAGVDSSEFPHALQLHQFSRSVCFHIGSDDVISRILKCKVIQSKMVSPNVIQPYDKNKYLLVKNSDNRISNIDSHLQHMHLQSTALERTLSVPVSIVTNIQQVEKGEMDLKHLQQSKHGNHPHNQANSHCLQIERKLVLINVSSLSQYEGFAYCIQEMLKHKSQSDDELQLNKNISKTDVFELGWSNFPGVYRISCMLNANSSDGNQEGIFKELEQISEFCETVCVQKHMLNYQFLDMVGTALQYNRKRGLAELFKWLKRSKQIKFGAPQSVEEGIPPIYDTLFFEPSFGGSIAFGKERRIPASVFNKTISDEEKKMFELYYDPYSKLLDRDFDFKQGASKQDEEKVANDQKTKDSSLPTPSLSLSKEEIDKLALPISAEPLNEVSSKDSNNDKSVGFPGMAKLWLDRIRVYDIDDIFQVVETHFILKRVSDGKVLMSAKNVQGSTSFIFATSYPSKFERHGDDYLGTMSCNIIGTTFTLYDHGVDNDELPFEGFPEAARKELAIITYDTNVLGRIPNAMDVVIIPHPLSIVKKSALLDHSQNDSVEQEMMLSSYRKRKMRTRLPNWNEYLQAWTLNFHGRVRIPSKKNFQLLSSSFTTILEKESSLPNIYENPKSLLSFATSALGLDNKKTPADMQRTMNDDDVVLLFGKYSKHRFSLDYRPSSSMNMVQAFSIALTTFADKLAVV